MTPTSDAIRVAVVGATGYAGAELVRYLARHPRVRLVAVTSEQSAGKSLAEVLPSVRDKVDLRLESFDAAAMANQCDVAFTALPQGTSAEGVAALLEAGCRVIDIGADFRFRDPAEHARVYGPHPAPELVARGRLRAYRILSRHRCRRRGWSPTPGAIRLPRCSGLLPLVEQGSDRSGRHRHRCEIGSHGCRTNGCGGILVRRGRRQSSRVQDRSTSPCSGDRAAAAALPRSRPCRDFRSPSLADSSGDPVDHLRPPASACRRRGIEAAFRARYAGERFIVLTGNRPPEIRDVVGTNDCAIGWALDAKSRTVVIVSVIDNLGQRCGGSGHSESQRDGGLLRNRRARPPGRRSLASRRFTRDRETRTRPATRTRRLPSTRRLREVSRRHVRAKW